VDFGVTVSELIFTADCKSFGTLCSAERERERIKTLKLCCRQVEASRQLQREAQSELKEI